ncbi:MarR family winged helix-turn-helix transcriptional regulator [Paractinoplanes durhamensis]|uniref:MarR family winged helix-turn-helix transcriptional regulator n=1 Tax=Paractinoplanes durhamensis TaxID=113563 RepID=UPI0036457DB8
MAAPDRTERDITGLLNMAGHVLSNRLGAALADVDLTPRMQCVLIHALEEERTQIQLAALADLDKTTMVSTVDDLERRGYAERRPRRPTGGPGSSRSPRRGALPPRRASASSTGCTPTPCTR